MTETELTMTMKFEETNLFILYPNPTVSAEIVWSMDSSYWWYDKPSNIPHAWHSKFIKDVTNFIFEVAFTCFLWDTLRWFLVHTKTNWYQQSNTSPNYIIPIEGNPSNKLKGRHFQVKCLSKCSILHWNHFHARPYIHPCFQVISLTVINILHRIGWFTRRSQNWVIVTLAGACPQTPSPTTLLLKRDPGPHRHH